AYLKQLEADFLKIDGSLIQGLPDDPLDRAVVSSLTAIARAADKKTVAECVESPEVLMALRECGVDFAQGHCIGYPQMAIRPIVPKAPAIEQVAPPLPELVAAAGSSATL